MSENRYGEKREESETGMKLQNCETQESENKVQESTNEQIKDMGQVVLNSNSRKHKVELLTIIGEVEGHESAPSHSKTTKYEHVLPKLAIIEDDEEIEGLLILLNTVGGDVEAGLAIAEMIASLSIQQCHWFWAADILSEFRWPYLRTILSQYQVLRW